MKIIPVLDILNENVVHGIAGKRKEYQPINNSVITRSVKPLDVIKDYNKNLGLNNFYIADLNMIQKKENIEINRNVILKIIKKTDFNLMLDSGCTNRDDAKKILDLGIRQVIIGSETLESLYELEKIIDTFDSERIILSLDFKEGELLTKNEEMKNLPIADLIEKVDSFSLNAIIILELKKVGSQSGPMNKTLQRIIKLKPKTRIIVGGGIRDVNDLRKLKEKGISGALIATAFHNGKITRKDLDLIG